MKYLILLFAIFQYTAQAQKGTTIEEYNYITKGYKIQVESGLDMKKGYKITLFYKEKYERYDVTYSGLYRDTESVPCAIMVAMGAKYIDGYHTFYRCVPNWQANDNIWELYYKSFNSSDEAALLHGLSKCVAFFAQNK